MCITSQTLEWQATQLQTILEFLRQVAACGDIALILAERSLNLYYGRQIVVYIGYDNMYTTVLHPNSNYEYT